MAKPSKLPRWADTVAGDPTKLNEPPEVKKDVGWLVAERPPAQWKNWLLNLTYEWLVWLQAFESTSHIWAALQTLNYGIVVSNATVNGDGIRTAGNGTGLGLFARGGASAGGVQGVAGVTATSAPGVLGQGDLTGANGGPGVRGEGGKQSPGGAFFGEGPGAGATMTGGATGPGAIATGQGGAEGLRAAGGGTNAPGTVSTGTGTAEGVRGTGGGTSGAGLRGVGGGPNGVGVKAEGTGNGVGLNASAAGTGAAVTASAGSGNAIEATGNITSTLDIAAARSLYAARRADATSFPTPSIAAGEYTSGQPLYANYTWLGAPSVPTLIRGRGVYDISKIGAGEAWITFDYVPANLTEAQTLPVWTYCLDVTITHTVVTQDNAGSGARLRARILTKSGGTPTDAITLAHTIPG